jgi:hypothetical protein
LTIELKRNGHALCSECPSRFAPQSKEYRKILNKKYNPQKLACRR